MRRLSHVIDRVGDRMAFVGVARCCVYSGDTGDSGEVGLAVVGGDADSEAGSIDIGEYIDSGPRTRSVLLDGIVAGCGSCSHLS